MSESVSIRLVPAGLVLSVKAGTPLPEVLFEQGVEFPCGGRGRCKGCKIRVVEGELPISREERQQLVQSELAAGWRLACRARADANLTLELAQWEAPVLTDDTAFAFDPQPGLGVAIDLGTTTLAAQLLDLQTGCVLAVRTALNPQARHGADLMSRIEFTLTSAGEGVLEKVIREKIHDLLRELLVVVSKPELRHIVLVGNTVMHHLFCGLSLEPLAHYPFEPASPGLQVFKAADLGWNLPGNPQVRFLPCLGGFVGSDILAGILATRLHEREGLAALIDLGTNGEIVVGNRKRLLCASTAAGPAFEGARIAMGMRAATGAIFAVQPDNGKLRCQVLGQVEPRGICGSGLVDAVAAGLTLGWISPTGRLEGRVDLPLAPPVVLTQRDIRELQLAKGAIAAGLRLLLAHWDIRGDQLDQVYLAGAFGNYVNQASASRIGLFEFPPEKIRAAGNTALLGAKLALFDLAEHGGLYPELLAKTQHVSLNEEPAFQEAFAGAMFFPRIDR